VREAGKRFVIAHTGPTPTFSAGVLLAVRCLCEPRRRQDPEQDIWHKILKVCAACSDIRVAHPTRRNHTRGRALRDVRGVHFDGTRTFMPRKPQEACRKILHSLAIPSVQAENTGARVGVSRGGPSGSKKRRMRRQPGVPSQHRPSCERTL